MYMCMHVHMSITRYTPWDKPEWVLRWLDMLGRHLRCNAKQFSGRVHSKAMWHSGYKVKLMLNILGMLLQSLLKGYRSCYRFFCWCKGCHLLQHHMLPLPPLLRQTCTLLQATPHTVASHHLRKLGVIWEVNNALHSSYMYRLFTWGFKQEEWKRQAQPGVADCVRDQRYVSIASQTCPINSCNLFLGAPPPTRGVIGALYMNWCIHSTWPAQ